MQRAGILHADATCCVLGAAACCLQASRLGITTVVSTDSVRHMLRR
jgi:hypothetical protein